MLANAKAAKHVSDSMLEICRMIERSLDEVKESCSPGRIRQLLSSGGKVVAAITFDVLEPLYSEHPTLKPSGWD
jgi:hypothetical protein